MSDPFDILEAQLKKQKAEKLSEVAAFFDRKIEQVAQIRRELSGNSPFASVVASGLTDKPDARKDVKEMGLTDAVIHALKIMDRAVRPPEVRDFLKDQGFVPKGNNFDVSVGTTLRRLAEDNRITKTELNGKTVYMPNRA